MDGMESSQIITQPLVRQNSCMTLGLTSVFQNHETSPAKACQGALRFCQQLLPSQAGKVFVNINFAMILQNMWYPLFVLVDMNISVPLAVIGMKCISRVLVSSQTTNLRFLLEPSVSEKEKWCQKYFS